MSGTAGDRRHRNRFSFYPVTPSPTTTTTTTTAGAAATTTTKTTTSTSTSNSSSIVLELETTPSNNHHLHHGNDHREGNNDKSKKKSPKKRRPLSFILSLFWKRYIHPLLSPRKAVLILLMMMMLLLLLFVSGKWLWLFLKFILLVEVQRERPLPSTTVDFLIAGFPKCGTTTLLFFLSKHPQVIMDDNENCQIARPLQQDDINLKRLNRYLDDLLQKKKKEKGQHRQRLVVGMKCPDAVKNFKAIHRLAQHSPHCKFVIGLRHPIWYLQSFYNYRVLESYLKKKNNGERGIPTLHDIYSQNNYSWWDISPYSTRYELFLAQFGKTNLTVPQMQEWFLDRPMLAVKPNRFRIFLYVLDQMDEEEDNGRYGSFQKGNQLQRDLQRFLELSSSSSSFSSSHGGGSRGQIEQPLPLLGHENKIQWKPEYKEHIDICAPEFRDICATVLHHAQATVRWMEHELLASPDVVVSNRPQFLAWIHTWTQNPCPRAAQSGKQRLL